MLNRALTLLALVAASQAHMHLYFPPTLKGDNNPFTVQGQADPLLNYPYGCCGKEVPGPCKGHLELLDTDEGKPTATWSAGQSANFSLSGQAIKSATENPLGGTHGGGSCQVGFSTDKGKTFKVVKTWNGNCPPHENESRDPADQIFDFTVPADLPQGNAVFAWTWVNREKEFNMNCAAVSITSGNGNTQQPAPSATKPSTPSATHSTAAQPTGQYRLEGCTCYCPSQTFSTSCQCSNCESPVANRRDIERKALAMHKRELARSEKLNAPLRRAEAVAFNSRPDMLLSIDFTGSSCHSAGNPTELKFPNPGPDVEEKSGDDGYQLVEPSGDC